MLAAQASLHPARIFRRTTATTNKSPAKNFIADRIKQYFTGNARHPINFPWTSFLSYSALPSRLVSDLNNLLGVAAMQWTLTLHLTAVCMVLRVIAVAIAESIFCALPLLQYKSRLTSPQCVARRCTCVVCMPVFGSKSNLISSFSLLYAVN